MLATITGAVGTLGPDLLAVGGAAIVVSAGIFGIRKGWKFFRGMIG